MIEFRELRADDTHRLRDIDRSEHIDGVYRVVSGALGLDPASLDSPTWSTADVAAYVARVNELLRAGGRAVGAWERERLLGFASLDVRGVGGDPTLLQLDMLYVSRASRGCGIGRSLTHAAARIARSLGATSLYISATPTRGTVDAYLRLGAVLVGTPDPALFASEPEDIHLVLALT